MDLSELTDQELEGLSQLPDADIQAYMAGDIKSMSDQALAVMEKYTPKMENPSGWKRGLRDMIDGAAVLAAEAVPDPVENFINRLNNKLVDMGLPLERLGEGGVRQMVTDQEKQYQQARRLSGETGVDWDRLGGNVISPANLVVAGKLLQGTRALGAGASSMRAAAGVGAGTNVLMPESGEGDFWVNKAEQAGIGALGGALGQAGVGAISRAINPMKSAAVSLLQREGISPTVGHSLGGTGAMSKAEDALVSLPVLGSMVYTGQKRALTQLNRAVANRALSQIGRQVPDDIEVGRPLINYVDDEISEVYEKLLPDLVGIADDQFQKDISKLVDMSHTMAKGEQFRSIIDRAVVRKFTDFGRASGRTLKDIETRLGEMTRNYTGAANGDDRELANALAQLRSDLRGMIERVNPHRAGELQAANAAWRHYVVMRDAAAMLGAPEGVFSGAQLQHAVKANTPKAKFAKGKGTMQDLSEAAKDILSVKLPNSGTADRGLQAAGLGALLGGTATIEPNAALAGSLLAVPYLPGVQRAASALLARRPEVSKPIADTLRALGPFAAGGSGPLAEALRERREARQ